MNMLAQVETHARPAERPGAAVVTGGSSFEMGGAERRMHVRAYSHWVSLLKGRNFPSIADIDPAAVGDFSAHGVLFDFAGDRADPCIAYLGDALRQECRVDGAITRVREVPARSLLARLTDHYRQIVADRAPIGFEAEFIGARGRTTLYRGILLPFAAADGGDIGFVYGVINWKEVADPVVQAGLDAELGAALLAGARARYEAPVWADGPHAGDLAGATDGHTDTGTLADALAMARRTAAKVHAADARRRTVLHRALGRAHDLALAASRDPAAWARLAADAGIPVRSRVSMLSVATLVFGADHDSEALADFAAVLDHARRNDIATGRLAGFVEGMGGIDAIVAAERRAKRRGD